MPKDHWVSAKKDGLMSWMMRRMKRLMWLKCPGKAAVIQGKHWWRCPGLNGGPAAYELYKSLQDNKQIRIDARDRADRNRPNKGHLSAPSHPRRTLKTGPIDPPYPQKNHVQHNTWEAIRLAHYFLTILKVRWGASAVRAVEGKRLQYK